MSALCMEAVMSPRQLLFLVFRGPFGDSLIAMPFAAFSTSSHIFTDILLA
jgi:hypothetical protein